jgi:cytidyltransferase-like protein
MVKGLQVSGSIIRLKPEYKERYKALHRNTFPGVLSRIRESHITDYSIFLENGILFSRMIYQGLNFESDMKEMNGDKVTRDWWLLTGPMQEPMEGRCEGEWWATLEKVVDFQAGNIPSSAGKRWAFIAGMSERITGLIEKLQEELSGNEYPFDFVLTVFRGFGHYFIYLEVPQTGMDITENIPGLSAILALSGLMEEVFHTDTHGSQHRRPKRAFVTGCFDMLHSGHIAFLQEAAGYGELFVSIGSDANVAQLKGHFPVYTESERKYLLSALSCVSVCMINSGWGIIDFEAELNQVHPDIFIVNEDGHSPVKEALCKKAGIEYKVLKRLPYTGLPSRSTTLLRSKVTLPFRLDLAGGWLDQPFVSTHYPGSVLTISIEPTIEFNDRSGMASSTRMKAIELWRNGIPAGNPELLAKMLFCYENPPGTQIISGSQDALGIVLPGLNNLHYSGSYWPDKITSVLDEDILGWIEQHLYLVTLEPRDGRYDVLANSDINRDKARDLAMATDHCWNAVLSGDLAAFGDAFRRSFEAQVAMFPNMAGPEIYSIIERYRNKAAGWKLSGAGGGGYLILVAENPIANALQIRIRRKNNL